MATTVNTTIVTPTNLQDRVNALQMPATPIKTWMQPRPTLQTMMDDMSDFELQKNLASLPDPTSMIGTDQEKEEEDPIEESTQQEVKQPKKKKRTPQEMRLDTFNERHGKNLTVEQLETILKNEASDDLDVWAAQHILTRRMQVQKYLAKKKRAEESGLKLTSRKRKRSDSVCRDLFHAKKSREEEPTSLEPVDLTKPAETPGKKTFARIEEETVTIRLSSLEESTTRLEAKLEAVCANLDKTVGLLEQFNGRIDRIHQLSGALKDLREVFGGRKKHRPTPE